MEIAAFIASALAGSILKGVATDAYEAVKVRLVEAFGMKTSVEALESSAGDKDVRELLEKKLEKTGAASDEAVLKAVQEIAAELKKLPQDTALGASLTVHDISAADAAFRRNKIYRSGSANFERMNLSGTLTVEDNIVGDDRKR